MARLTLTADNEGTITALEGDVQEILGWDVEALLGQPLVEIVPFKYRERHAAGWERWQTTRKKRVMGSWLEVEARRADGNVIAVSFCVTEREGVVSAILETPSDPELPALSD